MEIMPATNRENESGAAIPANVAMMMNANGIEGLTIPNAVETGVSVGISHGPAVRMLALMDALISGRVLLKSHLSTVIRGMRRHGVVAPMPRRATADDMREAIRAGLLGPRLIPSFVTDEGRGGLTWAPMDAGQIRDAGAAGLLGEEPGMRVNVTLEWVRHNIGTRKKPRFVHRHTLTAIRQGLQTAEVRREWIQTVNSGTPHGIRRHSKPVRDISTHAVRGRVRTALRFACDKNRAHYIKTGKVRCSTRFGVPSFAPADGVGRETANSGTCPTCGGPATVDVYRAGASTVNGTFVHAFVCKPNGSFVMNPDDHTQPKICQVHRQKIGGRHPMKINGHTVFTPGSFVRCLYPVEARLWDACGGENVPVWVFVMSGERVPDYDPLTLSTADAAALATMTRQANLRGLNISGAV